jgi:2-keto-4-pentenoate hydratase/2-oxohepta-3-ene-1,7-dioic acid hydratase in catechol pathway
MPQVRQAPRAAAIFDQPFLKDGQVVTVTIEGIGSCRNEFYAEA